MAETVELFGSKGCQHTADLREQLEWDHEAFLEYDVEEDQAALRRMVELTGGGCTVPVLVRNGKVVQVGWQGRGCIVSSHVFDERASPPAP